MGSAFSCGRCPTAETSSVINLSDALILRMLEGIEVPGPAHVTIPEDEDWFEKLKCIDDAHSTAYGLTYRDISNLIKAVEKRIKDGALVNYCPSDVVKGCYRFNSGCTLKCAGEVEEFINCVDTKRLQRLRILVEKVKQREKELERLRKKRPSFF